MGLDSDQVSNICKLMGGVKCCKYLVCGYKGFECGKLDTKLKSTIDSRDDFRAAGDNCDGVAS